MSSGWERPERVLFVSNRHQQCGIQQYGRAIGAVLQTSRRYEVSYVECESAEEYRRVMRRVRPDVVLYNYYWLTMPWLTSTLAHEFDAVHIGTIHEITPQEAAAAHRDVFDYHVTPDPTLVTDNPLVFKLPRLIPAYSGNVEPPQVVTVGSFGFGFADKGFERLVSVVQEEFDEAVIRLHLPFSHYADHTGEQALACAKACRESVTRPGIHLQVTHEFLSPPALLDWLAGNHINVFLYDVDKRRGISSVIDLALAVRRPLAINRCEMFRHLFAARPSICIEDRSLREILAGGTEPLEPFYREWTAQNVVRAYEEIFDSVLGSGGRQRGVFNRILDERARRTYRPAIDRLFSLVPEMMARKIPEANVQQAFVLDTVERFAAERPEARILCVGSHEDTACAALKRLGFPVEEIDPVRNYDLAAFCSLPTTRQQSYDIVFSTSVLEHVEDDETFMVQLVELVAPGGVAILTLDYNDCYLPGDPVPAEDLRFYTQRDLKERILPLLEGVKLVDEPDWDCAEPDFSYGGCRYTFATMVLLKTAALAEVHQARRYWSRLPRGAKILINSEPPSDHSPWTDDYAFDLLTALRDLDPVFVFTSKVMPRFFPEFIERYPRAIWCREPSRLNAELCNLCDAFIGVWSGISALASSDRVRRDLRIHLGGVGRSERTVLRPSQNPDGSGEPIHPVPLLTLPTPPAGTAFAHTVGVDVRTLYHSSSVARGIGHYTLHHLDALVRAAPDLRFWCYGDAEPPDALQGVLQATNAEFRCIDEHRPGDVDLLHVPDQMNISIGFDSPLRVFRGERTTVTFYDLTPLREYWKDWPENYRRTYTDRLEQLVRGDAAVLAISEHTRRDLLQETGISEERTHVVMAGLNRIGAGTAPGAERVAEVRRRHGLDGEFFLHVGALDPHKNFPTALTAYLRCARERPSQLVVVGQKNAHLAAWAKYCATKGIEGVVFPGFVSRGDLEVLYGEATALVFLSRYEGFGFPVLEAMAHGCPVITTNATSIPEVAGDAALMFDPADNAGAAAAMRRLLDDPQLRADLTERGLRRAGGFSWERTARATLDVWRRMLGGQVRRPPGQRAVAGVERSVAGTR